MLCTMELVVGMLAIHATISQQKFFLLLYIVIKEDCFQRWWWKYVILERGFIRWLVSFRGDEKPAAACKWRPTAAQADLSWCVFSGYTIFSTRWIPVVMKILKHFSRECMRNLQNIWLLPSASSVRLLSLFGRFRDRCHPLFEICGFTNRFSFRKICWKHTQIIRADIFGRHGERVKRPRI